MFLVEQTVKSLKYFQNPYIKNPFLESFQEYLFYLDEQADYKLCEMTHCELKLFNSEQIKEIKKIKIEFNLTDEEAVEIYVNRFSKDFRKSWHLKKHFILMFPFGYPFITFLKVFMYFSNF